MKIHSLVLPTLLFTVATLGASKAHAQAAVTVQGRVTAGTCAVGNISETMPDVSAGTFPQVPITPSGSPGSYTPFNLVFTGCSGVTGVDLTFGNDGDKDPDNAGTFLNRETDPALHTSIWIRESAACNAGTTVAPGSTKSVAIAGGNHTVSLCAQYNKLATGLVTAGNIGTNFIIDVVYK